MPKVKYCVPVPPPNMLRDLFTRHMRAKGVSSAELAERLHMPSAGAVRSKKHSGTWTSREIREWCAALGIEDPEEVGKAVLKRLKPYRRALRSGEALI